MNSTSSIHPGLAHTTQETGTQARLAKTVQTFEGVLWSEVADLMLSTQLGPTGLGYAGSTYQRMLWGMITQRDFGAVDQSLTQATLKQLGTPAAAQPETTAGALRARATPPASTPALPSGTAAAASSSPLDWARKVWGHITAAAQALKVPANALLAQSALETDWGQDATAHNLFGIKSHGDGPSFIATTREYVDGALRETKAAFRHYASDAQAVLDYVTTIRSRHPEVMGQPTVAGFAQALQASGYATDPRYAAKIEAVADSPRMQALLQAVQDTPAVTNSVRGQQP